MRDQGVLVPLPCPTGQDWPRDSDVAWDGEHLWVLTREQDAKAFVFDGSELTCVATFTARDGLPPTTHGGWLAALAPGRVCALGCIGQDRTWIANLSLSQDAAGTAHRATDVFHESRLARVLETGRDDPRLAFRPQSVSVLVASPAADPLVIVARDISPHGAKPLVVDVADNAYGAAFKDNRFKPLAEAEIEALDIDISLLSASRAMKFSDEADLLAQLRPGVDGLIISDGGKRGLFLPSVWESLPTPADFLTHLKTKAGLKAAHWSPDFKAARFTTVSTSFEALGGEG
ncbi:MAG: AmmeMemoRadiSam system protein A [Planctomycetes bacterium]|nr:AmmeMemoRadiSam system protein A [Planctomycetota bacterium]